MFTGLIEETGTVLTLSRVSMGLKASYQAHMVLENTKIGDSISVNGICQTVTDMGGSFFVTDISAETLRKTNAGSMKTGEIVNLERAMALGERLGGHLVQGHVNGTAEIRNIRKEGEMYRLTLDVPSVLMKYMIDEGSIAVDGISLTIASAERKTNRIQLQIIPHTYEKTTLAIRKNRDRVNIETDMLGRYVENLMSYQMKTDISTNQLTQWGYGQ
ncbi:riboflavin synthase [Spirochaeta isovalerica]|uniref:Riboflavin synthase n=1 Tax=Spirochaeta isovalerica TaxID=150 RepID=A0A841R5V1_9SPIO|nr:riboflavin synthase [Spirochaeta isovalerica]MBB6478527.1 riboflavin synthase [Spirochaeta isovalerica]